MLYDIDHLQLAMPPGAEEKAREFYVGVLGLEEVEKPPNLQRRGGVWFKLGNRQIHLGVQQDFRPATKSHPAFRAADLFALKHKLISSGYPIIDDEPLPGYERFYSRDPFGNRLEFLRQLNPAS